MAVKIADIIESMNPDEFPIAMGSSINLVREDGTQGSMQEMYDYGEFGGIGLPLPTEKDNMLISTQNEESGKLSWIQINKDELDMSLNKQITSSVAVGGIKEGDVFDENTSFTTLWSKLLEKYISPLISIAISPTTSLYKKGTSITLSSLKATITKKTESIQSVSFYKDSTLLEEITNGVESGGTVTCGETLDAITTNTTYKASVKDIKGGVVDSTKTISFAIPFYYGNVNNDMITMLEGLTEDLSTKGSKTYTFSPNNQYVVILYDSSYETLKSIKDQNNFENLSNFVTNTVTINDYSLRYYISNGKKTLSNFKFTFTF